MELLHEKGYISFVDVLIRMGRLSREDHEAWRARKVHYLERVIKLNLAQVNHLLRTLQQNAVKGGLKASKTAYMSWGKGAKTPLRFSKSGDPNLEVAYATHYLKAHKEKVSQPKMDEPYTANFNVVSISCQGTQILLRSSRSISPTFSSVDTSS